MTVEQVDNADVQTLFDKNELDAALVPEPWGSTLVAKDQARIVLNDKTLWRNGKYATAVVIARKDFIQKHSDVLKNFLKAHVQLTETINKDPSHAQTSIIEQIKQVTGKTLSSSIMTSSFQNTTVVNDPSKASVLDFAKFAKDAGYLKGNSDFKDLFALDILNQILKAEGKPTVS